MMGTYWRHTLSALAICVALAFAAVLLLWFRHANDVRAYYHFDDAFPAPFGVPAPYDPDLSQTPLPTRSYGISDGTLVALKNAATSSLALIEADKRMWSIYSILLPSIIRSEVVEFDSTDAPEATAYSINIDASDMRWLVNIATVRDYFGPDGEVWDRGYAVHTLVHEIGHVMTLGRGSVDFKVATFTCPRAIVSGGCMLQDSFAARYAARFWPDAPAGISEAPGTYNPADFVSPYAANNLAEDLAETWAAFVLLPRPTGTSRASEKVRFFYDDPSMARAREEILRNLPRVH